jgi:hypothetical protein
VSFNDVVFARNFPIAGSNPTVIGSVVEVNGNVLPKPLINAGVYGITSFIFFAIEVKFITMKYLMTANVELSNPSEEQ